MPSNHEIFENSVRVGEPLVDLYYRTDKIVIPPDTTGENELVHTDNQILALLESYATSSVAGDIASAERSIEAIRELLVFDAVNMTAFVTFWATLDVSFSVYRKLPEQSQRAFLSEAIALFVETRLPLYRAHGISATVLQVQQDSFAHKGSGEKAIQKLSTMFAAHGFRHFSGTPAEFLASDQTYILPDSDDSVLWDSLLQYMQLDFEWGRVYQGKRPDAAFIRAGHVFLIEHKHKKEGGGGQGGQLSEIIRFIQSREENERVHYISFLDGVYFNELVHVRSTRSKVYRQLQDITAALEANDRNYFLNTAGFEFLLGSEA